MYDRILVPTDGGDHSVRAAAEAATLARLFDATVCLVGVVDVQAAGGLFDAGGVDRVEATAENAVAAAREGLGGLEAVGTEVVRGRPAAAIVDYATDHDIDLVAMGTHGRTGVRRFVLGSVTERVVRHSPVPVLTARATAQPTETSYDEVLVPTDGSEAAGTAVAHALAVASAAEGRIHAVHVVDAEGSAAGPGFSPPPALIERLESTGQTAVDDVATRARAAGLDAVTAVRHGRPAAGILEYVDEHDIDLVAMATTGRTGLDRVLLGSTAARVLRRSEVPVLAVPGHGDDVN